MQAANTTHIAKLRALLTAKSLDRREFVLGATAAGMTLSAAIATADKVEAATPKSGGILRLGVSEGATSDSLDPATYTNGFSQNLAGCVLNRLTEIGNDGQLYPELAESFEASKDAASWTFKLRRGVEFHNGKSLTSDDVIASFQHHLGDDSKSGAGKAILGQVEEFRKDDDFTFTCKLQGGNADFPFSLSDYHISIMPSKDGKLDWSDGVGTGAYVIDGLEPGVSASLKKNPNYWKAGRGHFDQVDLIVLLDSNARVVAAVTNEVDAVDQVPPKLAGRVADSTELALLEVTGTQHYTMPMRCDTEPFSSLDVRMAVKLAVDRDQLLQSVLAGHGALGNDSPITPANRYFHAEMPQRNIDIDKAKFHLKKAGYENLSLKLHTSDGAWAGAIDAAVLIKETAKAAGIDIEVVREPADGYWSNVWNKRPWSVAYWGGRPTEDAMFSAAYEAGSSWNDTAWKNDRFNELLFAARAELDEETRRAMYYEMQEIVRDDGGALIPLFANHVMAVSKNVQHEPEVAGNWAFDGGRAGERWWFG